MTDLQTDARTSAYDANLALEVSEAISVICDCAFNPERWRDALRHIAELSESPMCSLGVQNVRNPELTNFYDYGCKPEFRPKYQKYIDLSPIEPAPGLIDVGTLMLDMARSDEELFGSRYYNEVLKPFGYLDFMGLLGLRSSGRVAGVHVSRRASDPRYGQREIALFNLLLPHIWRALSIADALDLQTLKAEMLERTLNGLASGVYLTGQDGQIIYMNAAAEQQIKTGDAIRVVQNRLSPVNPDARGALTKAINIVAGDEIGVLHHARSFAVPDAGGVGYVATLLSLHDGARQSVMAPFAASVAIFMQDPEEGPHYPGEAFARLYGLTSSELRVLLALAQGLTGKEAAEALGVSETTMRTHISHMLAKTGASRQADLLRLLHNAAPPTRGGDRTCS